MWSIKQNIMHSFMMYTYKLQDSMVTFLDKINALMKKKTFLKKEMKSEYAGVKGI